MAVKAAGQAASRSRPGDKPAPEPELIQLLTPEGERTEHPDYPLELTGDEIKALYRDLVLVRRIDFEAIALQRQGELGIWASLLGQEAAQVGSGRALGPRDMAFPTYREHGVAWCRGLDPAKLLELYRGVSHGGWDPKEHNFHLYTIVIGAQTLHATGYAMGIQRDGAVGEDGEAAIVYFGDGATSQGDVNEAFIWASVTNAPVVFFCQNNQWAISEPLDRQTKIPLYRRAAGFGFPGIRVDGNDVLACLAVTRKALQSAREGQGPTLIEAFTYRMGAHTTTDDPTRYRLAAELEAWKLKDPIERVKAYLIRSELADREFFERVDAESGIVGTAIGLALRGYRPVCEIQFDGFVYPAFDQIVSQLAKMRMRSLGAVSLPVVIRIPCGGGIGAAEHHSESPEALFAHTPGLRVVACGDPADAYVMIQQAISAEDPVIFFEPKRRYWDKAEVDTAAGLANAVPLDKARTLASGTDVTMLAYGPMVRTCAQAAVAAAEDGRSVEVIDLRSLAPLDTETIFASVRRTGRCVVVHEAAISGGLGAEIAARVTEECFYR